MAFRLRCAQREIELPLGRFVIGRSATCQLALDDPLISRQHAQLIVTDECVELEDLGSRNGVSVNGARVSGAQRLEVGDTIRIGSQELVLGDAAGGARRNAATLRGAQAVRRAPLGVLGGLSERALALGHVAEAERLAEPLLQEVIDRAEAGPEPPGDAVERTSLLAIRLAGATTKGKWIDGVVHLHRALGRPLSAALVDELHVALRKVERVDLLLLRNYASSLRERAESMNPAERFLVSRIQGLERMAAMR